MSFSVAILLGLLAFLGNSSSSELPNLKVRAVTYNVGESKPENIKNLLGLNVAENERPDILLISLQEVSMHAVSSLISYVSKSDPWTKEIQPMMEKAGYLKVDRRLMIGLFTAVFIKNTHTNSLSNVRHMKIPTAIGGFVGTKGGIVTKFTLYGREFTMVGAHLPAHDQHFEDRITAYNSIIDGIQSWDNKVESDVMFWLGDLNFRLSDAAGLPYESIMGMINANSVDKLLINDELSEARAAGRVFQGWHEQKITFLPTFKLVAGSNGYNPKRRPAWTDRILFRSAEDLITPLTYNSMMEYSNSDHKPVVAEFLVTV